MKDIFLDRIANSHNKSQNFFMAELGLDADESQYVVTHDIYDDNKGGIVYIMDNSRIGTEKLVYVFHFSTAESVMAFVAIMEQEVGTWDVSSYHSGENIQQDAVESYERENSGVTL